MNQDDYDRIRQRLAAALKRDAALHQLRRYEEIGKGFLHFQATLKHGGDHRYQKLMVALRFWDAWIFARNTDWLESDPIPQGLWGTLGIAVAADLESDIEIRDSRVLRAFDLESTLEIPKRAGTKRDSSPLDESNFGFIDYDE